MGAGRRAAPRPGRGYFKAQSREGPNSGVQFTGSSVTGRAWELLGGTYVVGGRTGLWVTRLRALSPLPWSRSLLRSEVGVFGSPETAAPTSRVREGTVGSLVFLECVYDVEWDLSRKLDTAARASVPR